MAKKIENFGVRIGAEAPKSIQLNSIDIELKNRIWNFICQTVFNAKLNIFAKPISGEKIVWIHFLFKRIGELSHYDFDHIKQIEKIYDELNWHKIYELIEFIVSRASERFKFELTEAFNNILEEENSGFRIISGIVVPITNEIELGTVQNVIDNSQYKAASRHIEQALILLSSKTNPDYRNSIKESISGVESVCKTLSGKNNATLDDALKSISKKNEIHRALSKGFSCIYGYTSDAHGIRHAGFDIEKMNPTKSEAIYFVVSCSAFINFLISSKNQ